MAELVLDPNPPAALNRHPPSPQTRVRWVLRAAYPAPFGTVYVRYNAHVSKKQGSVDVLTPAGKLLQRSGFRETPPDKLSNLRATTLPNGAPLLRFADAQWNYLWAFPDGFDSLFSMSLLLKEQKPVWNGLAMVKSEKGAETGPYVTDCDVPATFAPLPQGHIARGCAAVLFEHRAFLRWVQTGNMVHVEVLNPRGRLLARQRFGTAPAFGVPPRSYFLSALWLDEKRKRGPVVEIRDSDQVLLMVWGQGLTGPLVCASFDDSSSSLSATTVSYERDKNGILEVWESYSERPDENGEGGNNHSTGYRWNGHGFTIIPSPHGP